MLAFHSTSAIFILKPVLSDTFFSSSDGGIQFSQESISRPFDEQISASKLREYLITNIQADALFQAESFISEARRWTIAIGSNGLSGKAIGEASDLILGGNRKDIFDGGAGSDFLVGGGGGDDLNGGAGSDQLFGGVGNDLLIGGDGDDTITAGKGSDIVEGGLGSDSYIYNAGDGGLTIYDSDGQGQVIFNGTALIGGSKSVGSSFVSDDGAFHFTFVGDLVEGGTLLINDRIIIKNFHNSDLGITLGIPILEPVDPDFEYQYLGGIDADGVETGIYPTNYELTGEWQIDERFIGGTDFDDHYVAALVDDSDEGGAPVPGAAGGFMEGKSGDDHFEGSYYFVDEAYGGPGNDVLVGAAVGEELTPQEFMGEGDFLQGNAGQDHISGSSYDDTLFGDDLIFYADKSDESLSKYVFSNGMIVLSNEATQEASIVLLGENAALPGQRTYSTLDNAFAYALGIDDETNLDSLYDDFVDGRDGNDEIVGGNGSDVLIGGSGDDRITGDYDGAFYLGPDAYQAGFGEFSHLLGKPGDDYLDGGDGDDFLSDEFGGSDQLYGGSGNDELVNVDADPSGMFYQGGVIPEFVVDINLLDGGDGDDRISSTSEHPGSFDYISGGAGNDTVEFVGNAAEIDLGSGHDVLDVKRSSSDSNLVIAGGGMATTRFPSNMPILSRWREELEATPCRLPVVASGSINLEGNPVILTF